MGHGWTHAASASEFQTAHADAPRPTSSAIVADAASLSHWEAAESDGDHAHFDALAVTRGRLHVESDADVPASRTEALADAAAPPRLTQRAFPVRDVRSVGPPPPLRSPPNA